MDDNLSFPFLLIRFAQDITKQNNRALFCIVLDTKLPLCVCMLKIMGHRGDGEVPLRANMTSVLQIYHRTLQQQLDGTSQCRYSIPITAPIWSHLSFVCVPIVCIKYYRWRCVTSCHYSPGKLVSDLYHRLPGSDQYLVVNHSLT